MARAGSRYRAISASVLLVVFVLFYVPAHADDEVDNLLVKLGDEEFEPRDEAQKELLGRLRSGLITPDQIKKIRDFAFGPPFEDETLEARIRAARIFADYVADRPTAQEIFKKIAVEQAGLSPTGVTRFTFGALNGTVDLRIRERRDAFNGLQKRSDKAKRALERGDTVAASDALDELRSFVSGLPNSVYDELNLLNPLGSVPKSVAVQIVTTAKDLIPTAMEEINHGAEGDNPGHLPGCPILHLGDPACTRTVQLFLPSLVSLGSLDISISHPDLMAFLPPLGFEIVGQVFDLVATDDLLISGVVEIGIEFGDIQLFGRPVRDPGALLLLRYSNGASDLLDIEEIDPVNHLIVGSYPAIGPGGDQFGEFAIIQAVPEPSSRLLLGTGLVGLLGYAWRRRTSARRKERIADSHAAGWASPPMSIYVG